MKKDFSDEELYALIKRLERFADLTDSKYRIPGTSIRFGLDALIGLIPILGEIVGAILSLYLLTEARRIGSPFSLKLKMILNILLDFGLGLIPIIGDIADIGFRSNQRNMKLLVNHIQEERLCRKEESARIKPKHWIPALILVCVLIFAVGLLAI